MSVFASHLYNFAFERFLLFIQSSSLRELEVRIGRIAQRDMKQPLSSKEVDDLKQSFRYLPTVKLEGLKKEIIKEYMTKLVESDEKKDIERCLRSVQRDTLLSLTGFSSKNHASNSFDAAGLTRSSVLKNDFEKEGRALLTEFLQEAKHFVVQFLDILVSATGLNEAKRQKHRRYGSSSDQNMPASEANYKLELYSKLLGYPAVVFGIVYTYITYHALALVVTTAALVASLSSLILYNRYFKPCPSDHEGLNNLTLDLATKKAPIYPRRDILQKIEKAFQEKMGVILIGESGCGKTLLVKSFTQAVAAGKLCHFLKGCQVFATNSSSFNSPYDGNSFNHIEERFKKYGNEIVFFFDEFHALFQEVQNNPIQAKDLLKTFTATFPYIIGATTSGEYKKYIEKQVAIGGRRFEVIHVPAMNKNQLRTALLQQLEHAKTAISFDKQVIDYIIEKAKNYSKDTSQVDAAVKILNRAIKTIASTRHPAEEDRVAVLKEEKQELKQQLINGTAGENEKELVELKESLIAKRTELWQAKQALQQKVKKTALIHRMEQKFMALKKQSYQLTGTSANFERWLQLAAYINTLEASIIKERKALGLPSRLDKDLIDVMLGK